MNESSVQKKIDIQDKASTLSQRFKQLNANLLTEIESLLATLQDSLDVPDRERSNDGDIDYVREIAINNSCQHYLHYVVELQGLVKSSEKAVRVAQRSLRLEQGPAHIEHITHAVELVRQSLSYTHAMSQIEQQINGVDLKRVSTGVASRTMDAARNVREILSASIQKCLKRSDWPPPLLPSSEKSNHWHGFEQAGEQIFRELQQLIVLMISLQMAVEFDIFSNLNPSLAQSTVLWPGMEFGKAIDSWISSHFAPNMPTCKIDKPEWLFSAVHHAVKICCSHVDIFEPCIETHGIQQYFSMEVEIGKAVYMEGLYRVVKGVYLPLMFEENEPSYILHYIDEAIKFEAKYRQLRIDPLIDGDINQCSHERSMIEILFENEDWASQWLHSEEEEARRRVLGLTHDPLGWRPSTGTPDDIASLHEFYPCVLVSNAMEIVIDLLKKTKYLHQDDHKLTWCQTVVMSAIETLTSHMHSELIRIEQFDHLTDSIGMPIISGSLNGLHFLEHMMIEPTGVLLETFVSSPSIDAFLENQVNILSKMRRKWTNKIVLMSMKWIFSHFLHIQLFQEELEDFGDAGGPSSKVIELRNQISSLLNEFSKHLDQVIFREVWKGIALSTSESFLEDLHSASQNNQGHSMGSMRTNLETLVFAFKAFTNKPDAYFKNCFDALSVVEQAPNHSNQASGYALS